ncbi:efflux RND transporter periplasmic adaptor subunit [Marinobacter lacisalsi]|uniref:Efflux RND transporter periplasmic adaptor subunit n=1 Tax=Marinobacter lacisalsi TaxID=475979 RepID=A0ABV8QBX4_9GAMM
MSVHTGPFGRPIFLSVVTILASGLAGCLSPEDPATQTSAPRVVDTALVAPANGPEQVILSGQVRASEHTRLSFEVGGEVRSLTVDVGDTVAKGQVLAVLDKRRYELGHEQALASEREAAAALKEARLDYQRQSDLADRGYGSPSRVDSATAALDSARYRHQAAVASRRIAERDLAQTELKAPFEGTVSERLAEPAERVTAGQPVLAVISDREGYEVETSVPETLVGHLAVGSGQQVSMPALGVGRIPATIHQIGSQPRSANNYPLTLILEESVPGLRSGMTAQVHLSLTQPKDGDAAGGFLVPLTALVHDGNKQAHLLRVGLQQTLERVEVEVLSTVGNQAVVAGPLDTGERIVARGPEFVAAGDRVSILGAGPERFH